MNIQLHATPKASLESQDNTTFIGWNCRHCRPSYEVPLQYFQTLQLAGFVSGSAGFGDLWLLASSAPKLEWRRFPSMAPLNSASKELSEGGRHYFTQSYLRRRNRGGGFACLAPRSVPSVWYRRGRRRENSAKNKKERNRKRAVNALCSRKGLTT